MARLLIHDLFGKIYRFFCKDEWHIAIREKRNENDNILNNRNDVFHVIDNGKDYWLADPFIIDHNNQTYVFFEMFDKIRSKGVIAYSKIINSGLTKPKIILDEPYHLSYPFIFIFNETIYMIPETHQSCSIQLYKSIGFPDEWVKERDLIDNITVADSTLFEKNGILWLFTSDQTVNYKNDKLLIFYNENRLGQWHAHKDNPIIIGDSIARPAGNIFQYQDKMIRPSQDCDITYGRALNLNRVDQLSRECYSEAIITRIEPRDLIYDKNYKFNGIHTYNSSGRYEVIDLRRNRFKWIWP